MEYFSLHKRTKEMLEKVLSKPKVVEYIKKLLSTTGSACNWKTW